MEFIVSCELMFLSSPRMLLAGIATAVLVLIGVGIWCAWRFLKKKRPQGQEMAVDDEQDLIGNEEAEPEEVEADPANNDFKGRIHYRLEYDFTTQELKVTVSLDKKISGQTFFIETQFLCR